MGNHPRLISGVVGPVFTSSFHSADRRHAVTWFVNLADFVAPCLQSAHS